MTVKDLVNLPVHRSHLKFQLEVGVINVHCESLLAQTLKDMISPALQCHSFREAPC